MDNSQPVFPLLIFLIGVIIVLAILSKYWLKRLGIPELIGYLVLGFFLSFLEHQGNFLTDVGQDIIRFLADIGLVCLLFRVGLESDLAKLLSQLRRASLIWIGDVFISGSLGFLAAFYLIKLGLIPSLFVAMGMTATSVGISVSVWQETESLDSTYGELMLDVAEMDDISAIFLMALLFKIIPIIHAGTQTNLGILVIKTILIFIFKAVVFAGFCFFFSRYIEPHITDFFRHFDPPADFTLMVTGFGFLIAAIAGLLEFSEAIGAFFAGLVFSRDPQSVKIDASFAMLYDLFVPFFFIGIGFTIDVTTLGTGLTWGLILLIAAVLGKFTGAGLPTLVLVGWQGAIAIGLSMIPRAEIMMVIAQHGLQLGEWAISPRIFAAMVVVCAATSLLTPLALRPLLQRGLDI